MMINHIITSSLVIIFVLLIGTIFENKISACLKYSLWLLVVIKLLVPVPGVESKIHVLNFVESYAENIVCELENTPRNELSYEQSSIEHNNTISETDYLTAHDIGEGTNVEIKGEQEAEKVSEDNNANKNNIRAILSVIVKVVYFAGVIMCFAVILISNYRFYKAFKSKRKYINTYNNKIQVYKIEDYYGACLYGGFLPVIIVGNNTNLSMEQQEMILLHEYVHYTHGDHIWSMIRNLCVALYWYNPLVWVAASVSRKDSELACDEGTIKQLGKNKRSSYGQTLLEVVSNASKKKDITSVAFLNSTTAARGKKEMKKRIEVIVKRKKTSRIAVLLTMVLSVACIGCTFGEPINETAEETSAANENLEVENNLDEIKDVKGEDTVEVEATLQEDSKVLDEAIIPGENKYVWPTKSTRISNGFGERIHPITGEKKMVDYIGIAGKQGDSIYAVSDGDIMDVGFDNTLGSYIVLVTATGEEITYGHLDGSKVPKGAKVKAGEIIGIMGKTGNATGPFLSISVKVGGEAVNPMSYFETDFLEETITYNGKEYKKSELCNATLRWLELSEQERMFSSYLPPEFMIFDETWGITLTAEDITSTGVTIKCTQSGGEATGELQTGSWYILETWTREYGWKEVPCFAEVAWTEEAWMIPMNDTREWKVNWEWLYGAVPSGKYRIGKSIDDFRGTGDYDTAIYYAEFEIKK